MNIPGDNLIKYYADKKGRKQNLNQKTMGTKKK